VQALAEAVVALGSLAAELGEGISALDVNPVVVGPDGVVAVDVFVLRQWSVSSTVVSCN
jgi:hypothetical protein